LEFKIRDIILTILQLFSDEFSELNITISVIQNDKLLNIDYDSMLVSLYYVIENATKYCCPYTDFKIYFSEETNGFSVVFSMVSISIKDNEVASLVVRGYRSETAKKVHQNGNGIGLYRLKKTLSFNDAELHILPRTNPFTKKSGDILYEVNEFRIHFNNQNNWFSHPTP
jgi:signal transduction histidine kinase